ncbi:MAG TPA: aminotransferase class IV [Planctomycetota bacterium]|nr:aminotransferase class IV [Planctomycetota bacterium]
MAGPERFPSWVDGRLVAPGEPALAADDAGFLLGLSVFDTLLLEGGWRYFEREHLARLREGCAALSIRWPLPWDPRAALEELCGVLERRDAALRITVTRGASGGGPALVVTARAIDRPADPGVMVAVSSFVKHAGDPLENMKSTNRLRNVLAREEALSLGAWEALIPTEEGDLSEGTLCNLFAVTGGKLVTPEESRGCLAGIVREALLEDLAREPIGPELVVGRIEPRDLREAQEVFLTNTTGRIVPVVEVMGLARGLPGSRGAVVGELRERWARIEAADRARGAPRS